MNIKEKDFKELINEFASLNSNEINFELSNLILDLTGEIQNSNIKIENDIWYKYLNISRKQNFLQSLNSNESRYRWAETAFRAIDISNFNLETLIKQRSEEHPNRILFKVPEGNQINDFNYKWIERRLKQIASAFLKISDFNPRVAIFSENTLEGASCDLACLSYDIFVSPFNVHFTAEILNELFQKININIAVTDSEQRLKILQSLREKFNLNFKIIYTGYNEIEEDKNTFIFEKLLAQIDSAEADEILSKRKRISLKDTATIMFTSGSTGMPKGVVFTIYNLISKRFARAAALPNVGNNELLLSYLPLYHTFGRYLELMGMIFWGGTYTFAGNPSVETLISLMQKLNPTGLISIPLRWQQIREHFEKNSGKYFDKELFHKIVGNRLHWGLSAAGYLDPKVFEFFHHHKVELCSGFGMTEATGGITMTPPGNYIKNSVGIPLPGVYTRLNDLGELEISGHYVAKYLDEESSDNGWIKTGDLFKIDKHGHYFIIDRVKDIYKNNRGQTVAPVRVEKLFEGVPGFKKTFLVGDGLAYNTLLIVPDEAYKTLNISDEKLDDYYRSIVASANKELAPYERVVDFTILERDFLESKGELTSKGTYKRKVIAQNFSAEIEKMYRYSSVEYKIDGMRIFVPRWIFRDLAATGHDIIAEENGLKNILTNSFLPIKRCADINKIQIGNFEYFVKLEKIDLGVFVRQPVLWVGNTSLINFAVCKNGWDIPYDGISSQIILNKKFRNINIDASSIKIENPKLHELNSLVLKAIYGNVAESLDALNKFEKSIHTENHKIAFLLKRRLEVLANHRDFEIRSTAYRILLLDEPRLDYSKYLPAFINSGLPFLDKKSIEEISKRAIEQGRIDALRQRLEAYRSTMQWPASENTITQFKKIFDLLVTFAKHQRRFYNSVREELVSWILHENEPALSEYAQKVFDELAVSFEASFKLTEFEKDKLNWDKRIVIPDDMLNDEIEKISKVICCSNFLKEALFLVYNEEDFNLKSVPENGMWISKLISPQSSFLYRISINTVTDKHFDLLLSVKENLSVKEVRQTIYWMIKISGYPNGSPILPKFGNFRSQLGAVALAYIPDLNVWDKIREYGCIKTSSNEIEDYKWKLLYIRGISAFFKAWLYSGKRILPGTLSPKNVIVPEPDFKENPRILSLSGWQNFTHPYLAINPLVKNFYMQALANYPCTRDIIKIEWIFDAIVEALGIDDAKNFLRELKENFKTENYKTGVFNLKIEVENYLHKIENVPYVSIQIIIAIERYREWRNANPNATAEAKNQFLKKLYKLYHLGRYPEYARFIFYNRTYFKNADEIIKEKLEKLIKILFENPGIHATRFIELSEFQESLTNQDDRNTFAGMVFPDVNKPLHIELVTVGDDENKDVVIKTQIQDRKGKSFSVRKTFSPAEVGTLYKIFIIEDYPLNISAQDQFLVVTDDEQNEKIVGGVCYKINDVNLATLEGITIESTLRGLGLGSMLLEDFVNRLSNEGVNVLTTHYHMVPFFGSHEFKVDSRWGGLVRFL